MYRITKRFQGYPFAHRQHNHDGHCALVHGHNWDFEICLESEQLDHNNFVYDFGKFKWLKDWLADNFDHTYVVNYDDPSLATFKAWQDLGLVKLVVVPSCSSEGLAKYVYDQISGALEGHRARVVWVKVYEDHKNVSVYSE